MNMRKHILMLVWAAAIAAMLFACAQVVAPTGGPEDKTGPVLDSIMPFSPVNNSLNFSAKEITINFDEWLKMGNYQGEIFISPLQKMPPVVTVRNKKLIIRLRDDLRENTTYVIRVGKGIKDSNAGNEMQNEIVYAFSTGDFLDSLGIRGKITDPLTGKGVPEMTVLLYPEEEIVDDSIYDKKPLYVSNTDESGKFLFQYLANRPYKIYAVGDKDKSFTYNQEKEVVAIAKAAKVQFPDSGNVLGGLEMQAFVIDQKAPAPKTMKWANDLTIVADFKEKIRFSLLSDSTKIYMADTLSQNRKKILFFDHSIKEEGIVLLYASRPRDQSSHIIFENLMDTLGNRVDTFMRIDPLARGRGYEDLLFLDPVYDPAKNTVTINATVPLRGFEVDSLVTVEDTLGNKIPSTFKTHGYKLRVRLQDLPDKSGPWILKIRDGLNFYGREPSDSTYEFPIVLPKAGDLGSIAGTLDSADFDANWIVRLHDPKGTVVRQSKGRSFDFERLKAGKYTISAIHDADQNGYWTPGSIHPYRMPEEVYIHKGAIDIRAKWDVEDFVVSKAKSGGDRFGANEEKTSDD